MQAHNVLKLIANKIPSSQKWGFPNPVLAPHMDMYALCRPLGIGLCAFFTDCLPLSLEDADF